MIFNKIIEINLIDNFIYFKRLKKISTSFFNNYYFGRPGLVLYFFYNHQKIITVVESIFKIEKNIILKCNYPNQKKSLTTFEKKIQHFIKSINKVFIYK